MIPTLLLPCLLTGLPASATSSGSADPCIPGEHWPRVTAEEEADATTDADLHAALPDGLWAARLRKLHLVRPDLIPYPLAYEVYC